MHGTVPALGAAAVALLAVGCPVPYGQTAWLGPFSCRSEAGGMTCKVTSGRGFTISNGGIAPVG